MMISRVNPTKIGESRKRVKELYSFLEYGVERNVWTQQETFNRRIEKVTKLSFP
jgi:hypothetical protein